MDGVDVRVRQVLLARQVELEVEKRLALIESYGDDNYSENSVIRFQKTFVKGGTKYTYAAIKAGGLWYTTGPKSPKGYTWNEFTAWLAATEPVEKWEAMIPANEELTMVIDKHLAGA